MSDVCLLCGSESPHAANSKFCIDIRLERARVVGVLDAFCSPDSNSRGLGHLTEPDEEEQCWRCVLNLTRGHVRGFTGPTADTARAAAAKAIEAEEV